MNFVHPLATPVPKGFNACLPHDCQDTQVLSQAAMYYRFKWQEWDLYLKDPFLSTQLFKSTQKILIITAIFSWTTRTNKLPFLCM